ncbi:pyruvate dehydrogenase [Sphingomonas sp. SRS2]|nr:pyruvate dehydrogenase [Sphingomonas sp. SRS2]
MGPEFFRTVYRKFWLIHRCDERFRAVITSGRASLIYYPVRGQELLAAAMGAVLRKDDYIVTTYRGLHDQLAKGVPIDRLWAEFLGRLDGTCKGKGGPMHITHPETGVMVTTGIVGSGLPIALGLALASQVRGDGRVTVVSFGDGASNIGAFHESLNMASLWKLPVVFFCQNNTYAEHTAYANGTSCAHVVDRAAGYAMRGVRVDGNDPAAMAGAAWAAVEWARAGKGPTLLEADTFRFKGHTIGSSSDYVPKDAIAAAEKVDPLATFRPWMIAKGYATDDQLGLIEGEIEAELDHAVEYGFASPFPPVEELLTDVHGQGVSQ